jgi:hypothetical protein
MPLRTRDFLKNVTVKAILDLAVWMNFYPHFPDLLSSLGDISCDISVRNAADHWRVSWKSAQGRQYFSCGRKWDSIRLYRGIVRHFESKQGFGVLYCIRKHTVRKMFIDSLCSSIVKLFSIVVLATAFNFEWCGGKLLVMVPKDVEGEADGHSFMQNNIKISQESRFTGRDSNWARADCITAILTCWGFVIFKEAQEKWK